MTAPLVKRPASGRPVWLTVLVTLLTGVTLAQDVQLENRVFEIAAKLRCPICTSESVADSSVQLAVEMRQIIQEQLSQGRSEAEILAFFQQSYGDWILLDPPKRGLHLLVWILPVVGAVIGVTALLVLGRRWQRRSREPIDVDPEDLARVRSELASGER
ncbi:MAG TPA: cytochrome c-type biogenesis protein [Trueperaceae bacterium]|nr:cytochrome c-type biogenesis protein [Trueperaceae bacterium]